MTSITLSPHAKVNLGLFIKGKRDDGYHRLETLLYPVNSLRDQLTLTPIGQSAPSLDVVGMELDGAPDDNLCLKAWRALKAAFPQLPAVHIELRKHIPAGAGLGGGSSDAAFMLRALNRLFALGQKPEQLVPVAAQLGADVPFFLFDGPMLASGTGTELRPLALEQSFELKVYPQPFHSSTVAAYQAMDYTQFDPSRDLASVLRRPMADWPELLHNDLEVPVFGLYPQLAKVKAQLYADGATYAAMSGSGSAMLALWT
jgi:4-diphosphocytidyl-2-C-methyl-D-erythritol kinase